MLLQNKKVAIIGAGPIGLTMARLLQQNQIDVTVYERDKNPQARIWRGTLDLHESSGQEALKKSGLLENYFDKAKPIGRTLANEQGKVFFSKEPEMRSPEINRNNLRTLLLDSLKSDTVIWDRKFISLEAQEGKWLLHFQNEMNTTADFVIGANGGMSNARKYITDTEVEYTGTYIIQGEVVHPEINCAAFFNLCNDNILMSSCNGLNLVANPNNNGALAYSVSFIKSEKWVKENGLDFKNTESIITFLCDMFADWDEIFRKLFCVTTSFEGLPARLLPLDKPWKSNRPLPITLIGDAAHLMPPFAGEGVNTGLMDAIVLSENLLNGKFKTIEEAIKDYEKEMFVYGKEVQLQTSKNEIEMHQPDFSFQKRFSN